jgi:hypothetical protein
MAESKVSLALSFNLINVRYVTCKRASSTKNGRVNSTRILFRSFFISILMFGDLEGLLSCSNFVICGDITLYITTCIVKLMLRAEFYAGRVNFVHSALFSFFVTISTNMLKIAIQIM